MEGSASAGQHADGLSVIGWVKLLECQESNLRSIYKAHILSMHSARLVYSQAKGSEGENTKRERDSLLCWQMTL